MLARVTRAFLSACLSLALACEGPTLGEQDGGRSRDAGSRDGGRSADSGEADAGVPGVADAGMADAGGDAAAPADSGPPPAVLYPTDRRHSPITAELATRLREVAGADEALAGDVFMKVGDSITASASFLRCFEGSSVDLDGRPLEATRAHFLAGDAAGTSPYRRESLAAVVGWSASAALAGDPPPLVREHEALRPRFGVVMFGTNDVGFRTSEAFARDVWTITDRLLARGTIPLLSTIPPRDDSTSADARVPIFNLAVRAIAQGRGVPLVDYHRELLPLPAHGLAGDGVHPQVYASGGCILTVAGLQFGANVRNLITLEQLDRALRALDGEALDDDAPRLHGTGAPDDPFLVTPLPFAAMGDTRSSPHRTIDRYGCSSADESGPERVYRLVLSAPARITASVLSAPGADVDVHLLEGSLAPSACLARDDREVSASVGAGVYYVVADTFVDAGGVEQAGEYLVLVAVE